MSYDIAGYLLLTVPAIHIRKEVMQIMFQGMEYIYEVYKEKSFSRAAANLFISQPSLSANVKRVEKRIGYPIFDRSTKPLGLTECGKQYIRAIEQIMAVENEFGDFVTDWGNLKTGNLTIGGSSFFSSWILPPLIADFARKYPSVKITLVEESTSRLSSLLLNGEVDLFVDNCMLDQNVFDSSVFQEEHLLLAVPRLFQTNNKLQEYQLSAEIISTGSFTDSNIKPVPMEAFANDPFIMLKQENDTGKRALRICQENHFQPQTIFELDQQMTAYNIACSGLGIAFIGDMLISRVPQNPDLVYYRLPGENCTRNIYFYWKKGRYLSRAMEIFLRNLN